MKNPYFELIRFNVAVLSVLGVAVGALVSNYFDIFQILAASFVAFFLVAGGNALNDYFDYKADKINKPNRPIPSGRISKKNALIFSMFLMGLGVFITFLLNTFMIVLALINTAVIILYNYRLKRTPFGHFSDSWLAASTFLFGALLTNNISFTVIILCLIAFFANLAREITKGIEDVNGDKEAGYKTLSVVIGSKYAKIIVLLSAIIAISFTAVPVMYNLMKIFYIPVVLICDALLIYSLSILYKNNAAKSQKFMKIAMYFGIFSFLAGMI